MIINGINGNDSLVGTNGNDSIQTGILLEEQVEVSLSTPSPVLTSRSDRVIVTYTNVSQTNATAPLLSLEATGANLRLPGESEFSSNKIQFLAINNEGLAGILPPGITRSLTIEFEPIQEEGGNNISFSLNTIDPEDIVNWEELRIELRPDSISLEAWDAIYDNFVATIGNTTGDYQAILVENANYFSELGEYIAAANTLIGFEFQKADNFSSIRQRYNLGSFGRGISFIGDVKLEVDVDGNVTTDIGGRQRMFNLQADGSYFSANGSGILTLNGDIYQLTETNGVTIVFRPDGSLNFIEDTKGERITAEYTGTDLTALVSSNGERSTFTRNENNRIISSTNFQGEVIK